MISKISIRQSFIDSFNSHSNIVRLTDSAFLTIVVIISAVLYLSDLGFYSDDWFHIGEFLNSEDQSFQGLLSSQWNYGWKKRPTQILYQTVAYSLFGLRPFGYHFVNVIVLSLMSILLYWGLREFGISRLLAISISVVYPLLPNYSTDRFWWASYGYPLTMCFYFLSLYADLRAIHSPSKKLIFWKMVAVLGILLSGLGSEVVVPLFLLNPVLVWFQNRRLNNISLFKRLGKLGTVLYFGSHFCLLLVVILYKSLYSPNRVIGIPDAWETITKIMLASIVPNFGTYIIGLPQAVWWAFQNSSLEILVTGVMLSAFIFIYITFTSNTEEKKELSETENSAWLGLAGAGLVIFVLGYSIFLVAVNRIVLSSSSYGNRWAIAGALGVAIILIAMLGLFNNLLPNFISRAYRFAALISVLCFSGFLINNALAMDHTAAWRQEELILSEIQTRIPKPKPNTTLILLGACPYLGSAMVFARYDLQGALWVKYRDKTLIGDVGTTISIEPDGLNIKTFDHSATYPYGPLLTIYDREKNLVKSIPDMESAIDFFGNDHIEWPNNCPKGTMDMSVPIFPLDKFYVKWKLPDFP